MKLEPNRQLGSDWCLSKRGDNAREDDGSIIVGEVNCLEYVRILPNHSFHVVEIGCVKGCAGIKHTAQSRAVLLLLGSACLQTQMRHWAVNRNRNLGL